MFTKATVAVLSLAAYGNVDVKPTPKQPVVAAITISIPTLVCRDKEMARKLLGAYGAAPKDALPRLAPQFGCKIGRVYPDAKPGAAIDGPSAHGKRYYFVPTERFDPISGRWYHYVVIRHR